MENYVKIKNLSVSEHLFKFINQEALPDTGISQSLFWKKFDEATHNLAIKNREIIQIRRKLQLEIDRWHLNNKDKKFNFKRYKKFLFDIGYLTKTGPNFKIKTKNLDDEISKIAGPQLVVPINNSLKIKNLL